MKVRLYRIAVVALFVAPLAALAHHPGGFLTPQTAASGFLSGLAHPAVEVGQLAFLIALGLCCVRWLQARAIIGRFAAGSAIGVLFAAFGLVAPAEPLLPVLLLGAAVALAQPWRGTSTDRRTVLAISVTVLAGVVHGQAAIEPVVGAPVSAFFAYGVALLIAQASILLLAKTLASILVAQAPRARMIFWRGAAAATAASAAAITLVPGLSLI